jgi:hypothetical protein
MNTSSTAKRWKRIIPVIAGIFSLAVLFACTPGTILKWNPVETAAWVSGDPGKQPLHTIRFETYGPYAEQLFGYFLYKDGIDVITGGGIPMADLGKRTIAEVMDDYSKLLKARQYSGGSNLIVREILRGGEVVGYTASDLNMDVNIWDITTEKDAKVVLRLVYRDLRVRDGGDRNRNMDDPS